LPPPALGHSPQRATLGDRRKQRLNANGVASNAISEIVAELRTARFQFLGKDTPESALNALRSALKVVADAQRLDEGIVDRVVETLEVGGVDSLAPDALRDGDG